VFASDVFVPSVLNEAVSASDQLVLWESSMQTAPLPCCWRVDRPTAILHRRAVGGDEG